MRKRITELKRPDLILTADWHLRTTVPECRTDDFISAMKRKVRFIVDLSLKHTAPIVIAGDLFDLWYVGRNEKIVPQALAWIIDELIEPDVWAIPGQHDLPNHSLADLKSSAYGLLMAAGVIENITEYCAYDRFGIQGFPWGKKITKVNYQVARDEDYRSHPLVCRAPNVAVSHQLVYRSRPPFPGCTGSRGKNLLNKHPSWDLIVTGDHHDSFHIEEGGTFHFEEGKRLLVNPGSIMRTTADQADFQPRVALWYAETNTVEWVDLPIERGVVSRDHIDKRKEAKERAVGYVERLRTDIEARLQFKDNMKIFLKKNPVRKEISDMLWESIT